MIRISFTFLAVLIALQLSAQLSLSKLFTDHMIVQRDHPINIWGTANPGSSIQVSASGISKNTKADMDGKWMVTLPASPAGGPYTMNVSSGNESIQLNDIFIGDVWLCSGQSNMEWTMENSNGFEEAKMNATDQLIRHFKVPHNTATKPDDSLEGGPWVVSGSETIANFTAVGYHFAKTLRQHSDVPIGLLNSSWGGSRLEPWMSAEALGMKSPESFLNNYESRVRREYAEKLAALKKKFPGLSDQDQGMRRNQPIWAMEHVSETNWATQNLPGLWEEQGYEEVDGIGWYRKTFEMNSQEASNAASISLAKIDDSDQVWVNGHFIGGFENAYNKVRVYEIAAEHLREGKNIVAVRVEDTGGGGGIYGSTENMYIRTSQRTISLKGLWKFKLGAIKAYASQASANHVPMLLYNKMIHPIHNFPIKGVIWYQGESNAGSEQDATRYEKLFKDMITQWRDDWGIGDFPFLFVQLANFMASDNEPMESNWAVLRESQSAACELPNVGEAVIIDIGEADDIHPRNKQDVGWRLAQDARKFAYGEDVVYNGPIYKSHSSDGKHMRLVFDQELVVHDKYGYVNGFAIAGADGKFRWAKAIANGNQVTVWHDAFSNPQHVRYAWGNNPDDVNLYNKEGMPTRPFRTGK